MPRLPEGTEPAISFTIVESTARGFGCGRERPTPMRNESSRRRPFRGDARRQSSSSDRKPIGCCPDPVPAGRTSRVAATEIALAGFPFVRLNPPLDEGSRHTVSPPRRRPQTAHRRVDRVGRKGISRFLGDDLFDTGRPVNLSIHARRGIRPLESARRLPPVGQPFGLVFSC